MKIPAKNPYKSRQSFGKALNRCRTELPCSPQKHTVVVSGLAKEVGFSIQNIMRNNVMEIPASVMSLKKLLKNSSFDLTFHTPCLELKMKWLYGMSLGNSDFGNITLPCTYMKLVQFSRKQGKRMKQCTVCPLSPNLYQKMFFF